MGYLKIPNLYNYPEILEQKRGYALEKVHGTSAHIKFSQGSVSFFAGGASYETFVKLFDIGKLAKAYEENHYSPMTVYGEAYGGSMQRMGLTYGDTLRFIVFDVKMGEAWFPVPHAEAIAHSLGLEFVPWVETEFKIETLDALRDLPSFVGERRGCFGKPREGIVLRPFVEQRDHHGDRLIAKHKSVTFCETRTPREVKDPSIEKLRAKEVALEWVTENRLEHVIDRVAVYLKIPIEELSIKHTKQIIDMMVDDVYKESDREEVEENRENKQEISTRAAILWKAYLNK